MQAISSSRMTINEFFEEFLAEAKASLERTPELLSVLKEAGVVDSGGAGLVVILEGMAMASPGRPVRFGKTRRRAMHTESEQKFISKIEDVDFKVSARNSFSSYRKWTIPTKSKKRKWRKSFPLSAIHSSCQDEDILKVHIHTLKPGCVLNVGQQYGEFVHLKIEKHDHPAQ